MQVQYDIEPVNGEKKTNDCGGNVTQQMNRLRKYVIKLMTKIKFRIKY